MGVKPVTSLKTRLKLRIVLNPQRSMTSVIFIVGALSSSCTAFYPTLYKLLDSHYISDREERAGKRRIRVYYHLEDAGSARLADLKEEYTNLREGIDTMLMYEDVLCEGEES